MKIFVISSSAIPTPPPPEEYGGLERIAGEFALEAARMGHEVTLISAKGSPLAGQWRFLQGEEQDPEKQKFGQLTCHETHMPSWNSGEFQHYLMYRDIMENEFGDGQGVVWDSTWQAWSYMSAAGMNMKLDPNKDPVVVKPHPKMKICHTHHGMPNSRTPPPRIRYP